MAGGHTRQWKANCTSPCTGKDSNMAREWENAHGWQSEGRGRQTGVSGSKEGWRPIDQGYAVKHVPTFSI